MSNWKKVVKQYQWNVVGLVALVALFAHLANINSHREVSPQAWSLYNGGPIK